MIASSTIRSILELLDDAHLVFVAEVLGREYLTDAEVRRLRQQGLLQDVAEDLVEEAYRFGVLSGRLPGKAPEDIKLGEFLRFMGGTLPALTFEEKQAIDHAKRNVAVYIRGLGNTVSKKGHQVLVDGNAKLRRHRMMQVRQLVSEGVDQRRTVKQVAQQLKELTQDQERDWLRIAATEVNNAFQEGRLAAIIKAAGGKDPLVFKRVAPTCCAYCRLLYVEKDGVTPRVFRLSQLVANGSNVGRKAGKPTLKGTGWKPVVESTHPWCFPAGVLVTTDRGHIPIEDVTTSDRVLTHYGRWRRVVELHRNRWSGWLENVNGTPTTPSHPYLTSRGWVAAEALDGGHRLLDASREILSLESNDGPTFSREVGFLRGILTSFLSRLMPVSSVDLDAELHARHSEIEIEDVDSVNRGHLDFSGSEGGQESAFQVRHDFGLLNRLGSIDLLGQWLRSTARSSMCVLSQLHAFLFGELGHSHESGLTLAAATNAVELHVGVDGVSVSLQDSTHLQDRLLLHPVKSVQQRFGQISSRMPSRHTPTLVHNCTKGKRQWFEGHVYNLSVWEDESYFANGVAVHNCQCVLMHKPDGFSFDKHGNLTYVGLKRAA